MLATGPAAAIVNVDVPPLWTAAGETETVKVEPEGVGVEIGVEDGVGVALGVAVGVAVGTGFGVGVGLEVAGP